MKLIYKIKTATEKEIYTHLLDCNNSFTPPLGNRVNLQDFSKKIFARSTTFEAWANQMLVGLLSVYLNDKVNHLGYINNVSITKDYMGKGIATTLLNLCVEHAEQYNFKEINLEVAKNNTRAIQLYKNIGFYDVENKGDFLLMKYNISRDYNKELRDTDEHKYAYSFDFDVMHPYMLKSFDPFIKTGNCLELGSFKGDFTKRLLPFFDHITCVEASNEAAELAKKQFDDKVKIINALFENVTLPTKYDNIILTHVLEHIDNPVSLLKRINDDWLSETGRLFLVCPNANAPSRQIAVKMGLITHNAAVTKAEAEHGHRITYTLDTLERDVKAAGLSVIHRSGIFFKALANFQWDKLLNTDIISKEYLEGCYQLGQQYPDLCSSIFLLCEKSK